MSTARRPFARTGVLAAVVVLAAATGCGASSTKTAGSSAEGWAGEQHPADRDRGRERLSGRAYAAGGLFRAGL